MKFLRGFKIKIVFFGIVAGILANGGILYADFVFGTPTNLGPTVNSSYNDSAPSLSADGLLLFFESDRPSGSGNWDLWVTTRQTASEHFGPPVNLGPTVNSPYSDRAPSISADGLALYFSSTRPGGYGSQDLWVVTRPTKYDNWEESVNLGLIVNSSVFDSYPDISADGLSLFFCSFRADGYGNLDLWATTRQTKDDDWGTPLNLGPNINSPSYEQDLSISANGLVLFFESGRSGGLGADDIWVATRASVSETFGPLVNIGPTVNTFSDDDCPEISANDLSLFFSSLRPDGVGFSDIWQVPINPVVDLNGDGIVDSEDMCIMVDHWHRDEPVCDIGPTPFGDGIVDVQDLVVLAEYLFKDLRLMAHWELDEAEGNIAYDSASKYNGILHGEPLWQPTGGQVVGALEFDGVDDYVSTPFVINPSDGAFSVFAWVKGGAAEQVIVSQTDGIGTGETWLGTESSGGILMTGLVPPSTGRSVPRPLESESVITDGQWHHIGFAWDGSLRHLYVDGAEVAKDTRASSGLESADGGLYIGVGETLDAASFFSGLIDDIRIYNQSLSAEEIKELAR